MRTGLAAFILTTMLLGCAGSARAARDLTPVRTAISKGCGLEGWQYALTPNAEDEVRVELSPTLAGEQVLCVYQALADYAILLDRPAPVEVKRKTVEEQRKIY